MSKDTEKAKEFLRKTNYFADRASHVTETGRLHIPAYCNCLIVVPLTAEAERNILKCPYTRILRSNKYFFALYYFPNSIEKSQRELLPMKYKTRLNNLLEAQKLGQVRLAKALQLLPSEILQLKFTAKDLPKRVDKDFKDDMEDTCCTQLAKPPQTFATIEKVNLSYNTLLILRNAKASKNSSLFHYLDKSENFYRDCIINYVLEHSKIISFENLKYPNPITEVHMPALEFLKLQPPNKKPFTAPKGVKITYMKAGKRLTQTDTVIIKFSESFLKPYKEIIQKSEDNVKAPQSFIKVPMFFVLEALKSENLGKNGFQFLLWLLPFFRMKEPKILHSLHSIMQETGMDLHNGLKKPLRRLQAYFAYLHSLNMLVEVYNDDGTHALKFITKTKENKEVIAVDINEPIRYRKHLITLRKPRKQKK